MLVVSAAILLHLVCICSANPEQISSIGSILNFVVDSSNCLAGFSQPANSNWTSCYQMSQKLFVKPQHSGVKVFTNFANKKSAAAQCSSVNGTLAAIPNAFVNSYLYYLANQKDATNFWIGSECYNGDSNMCVNDNATPFVYNNFYSGQPNIDGYCVYMSMVGRSVQQWFSYDCSQQFQFACEVPAGGTEKSLKCPQNYTQLNLTSMCYNYVYVGLNQLSANNASVICKQVPGGNLATIQNVELNSFLTTLQPKGYVSFGLVCPDVQFDGDKNSCKWNDGTPFTYNAFNTNCPTKPDGDSDYGNGCCDFDYRGWTRCWNCDMLRFGAYVCQAPMQ